MSAFQIKKRSWWSALAGLFAAPVAEAEPVAAHLRSMSPEEAARLLGAGSRPPAAQIASALAGAESEIPKVLPWPLFRTTGSFETEHAESDRALAECTAELAVTLAPETVQAVLTAGATHARSRPATHILAAQLAVVARLNQPKTRAAANGAALKAMTNKAAAAKGRTAKAATRKAPSQSTAQTGIGPAIHADHARPLAEVIDLAAVKVLRRAEKARRAA